MPKPTDRMSGTKSRLAQLRGASTEEELLAYQQEFLKSQERPAASVVRASRTAPATASVPSSAVEIPDSIAEDEFVDDGDGRDMNEADVEEAAAAEVRRRSLFQQRMQSRRSEAPMDETDAKIRGIADSERAAKHAAAQAKVASLGGLSVMGEIKEKVFETNINIQPLAPVAGIASSGFPSSFKTSSTSTGSQSTGKKSLFAQQMQAKKAGVPFVPEPTKAPESKARVAFVEPADDAVEDSHSLNFDAISAQNDKRLAAMSAAEIEAARAEILSSLSPELMSLLQSRGLVQNSASEFNTSAPLAAFPNITDAAEVEDEQLAEPEPAMPSVADQLLAWTQPVDTDASFEPKVESTSAIDAADRLMAALERSPVAGWRFDLDGNRLSAEAQRALPSHLGLHHHGDAPGLAGYTIAELLHLTRSRMAAQSSAAWRVLTRILHSAHSGTWGAGLGSAVWEYCSAGGILPLMVQCLRAVDNRAQAAACLEACEALLVQPNVIASWLTAVDASAGSDIIVSALQVSQKLKSREKTDESNQSDDESDSDIDDESSHDDASIGAVCKRDFVRGALLLQLPACLYRFVDTRAGYGWCAELALPAWRILHRLVMAGRSVTEHLLAKRSVANQLRTILRVVLDRVDIASQQASVGLQVGNAGKPGSDSWLISSAALRFAACACAASRLIASELVTDGTLGPLKSLLLMTCSQQPAASSSALSVSVDVLRIWRICVSHGLDATHLLDLHGQLMPAALRSIADSCRSADTSELQAQRAEFARAVFHLLGSLCISSSQRQLRAFESNANPDDESHPSQRAEVAVPALLQSMDLVSPPEHDSMPDSVDDMPDLEPNADEPTDSEKELSRLGLTRGSAWRRPLFPHTSHLSWSHVAASVDDTLVMLSDILLKQSESQPVGGWSAIAGAASFCALYFELLPDQPEFAHGAFHCRLQARKLLQRFFVDSWSASCVLVHWLSRACQPNDQSLFSASLNALSSNRSLSSPALANLPDFGREPVALDSSALVSFASAVCALFRLFGALWGVASAPVPEYPSSGSPVTPEQWEQLAASDQEQCSTLRFNIALSPMLACSQTMMCRVSACLQAAAPLKSSSPWVWLAFRTRARSLTLTALRVLRVAHVCLDSQRRLIEAMLAAHSSDPLLAEVRSVAQLHCDTQSVRIWQHAHSCVWWLADHPGWVTDMCASVLFAPVYLTAVARVACISTVACEIPHVAPAEWLIADGVLATMCHRLTRSSAQLFGGYAPLPLGTIDNSTPLAGVLQSLDSASARGLSSWLATVGDSRSGHALGLSRALSNALRARLSTPTALLVSLLRCTHRAPPVNSLMPAVTRSRHVRRAPLPIWPLQPLRRACGVPLGMSPDQRASAIEPHLQFVLLQQLVSSSSTSSNSCWTSVCARPLSRGDICRASLEVFLMGSEVFLQPSLHSALTWLLADTFCHAPRSEAPASSTAVIQLDSPTPSSDQTLTDMLKHHAAAACADDRSSIAQDDWALDSADKALTRAIQEGNISSEVAELFGVVRQTQAQLFSQRLPLESAFWGPLRPFFAALCAQFSADSYGDEIFTRGLMLPLRGEYSNPETRLLIWNEIAENSAAIACSDGFVFPLDFAGYLHPAEPDHRVLDVMQSIICERPLDVSSQFELCSLLVHHIAHALFSATSSLMWPAKSSLLSRLVLGPNTDLAAAVCAFSVDGQTGVSVDANTRRLVSSASDRNPFAWRPDARAVSLFSTLFDSSSTNDASMVSQRAAELWGPRWMSS